MSLPKSMQHKIQWLAPIVESSGASVEWQELLEEINDLDRLFVDRTLMLHRFIGMAQERIWPALETINEARKLCNMTPIERTGNI